MSLVGRVSRGLYYAVFEPAELVRARTFQQASGLRQIAPRLFELFTVYLVNLGLYAGPLTVAGIGQRGAPPRPAWFGALPAGTAGNWELASAFVQNSLFLLTATILALVTFQAILWLTRQSRGVVPSTVTVVYSTSVYLTGIFTLVWYLSTSAGLEGARTLVVDLQRAFVYAVIDAFDANLGLPGGRPGGLAFDAVSGAGQWVLAVLIVLALYFLYSLYLGARINHGADRIAAAFVVSGIAASPAAYVAGLVLAYTSPLIPTV